MAEIFNGFIMEARYKPMVCMLDDIYYSIMTRVGKMGEWVNNLDQPIALRIIAKLKQAKIESRWWDAQPSDYGIYSVKHGLEAFAVDLNKKECTCRSGEISGVPCIHSVAAMREC